MKDTESLESTTKNKKSGPSQIEEQFLITFEKAAVGIVHVSPEGQFLRVNNKFCEIVGYTKEEMYTRTFQDITHPDDLAPDLEYVQQILDGKVETYSMEKHYFRKDKSYSLSCLERQW